MDLSPDVLTYIQTVKNFLNKNEEARKYFLNGIEEELFYNHLSEIAEKNFESFGEPQLSREQFDLLRKTMRALSIVKKSIDELPEINKVEEDKIFIDYRGIGKICMN